MPPLPVPEYKLTDGFKLLGGFRYDYIAYELDNHLDASAYSGAPDSKNVFTAFTPRLGTVLKADEHLSFYANYSKGFRPPEVGELYRGVKVPSLEPVYYDNYEAGAWLSFSPQTIGRFVLLLFASRKRNYFRTLTRRITRKQKCRPNQPSRI